MDEQELSDGTKAVDLTGQQLDETAMENMRNVAAAVLDTVPREDIIVDVAQLAVAAHSHEVTGDPVHPLVPALLVDAEGAHVPVVFTLDAAQALLQALAAIPFHRFDADRGAN